MTLSASLLAVKFDIALLLNLILHLKNVIPDHCNLYKQIYTRVAALERWLVMSKVLQEVSMLQAAADYEYMIKCLTAYEKNKNANDKSILCLAARLGFQQIVLEMLSDGVDVETPDNNAATGLLYACLNGNVETVRVLVNHGAKIRLNDHRFFVHAQVVEVLIQRGAIRPTDYPHILFYAASNNHPIIIDHLLQEGVDPNIRNQSGLTPICVASQSGNAHAIQSFIKINAKTSGALIAAVKCNKPDSIEALLPVASREEITQATVLAARMRNANLVLRLIRAGGDPNGLDSDGDSLLLWAVEHQESALVKTLLSGGAQPNLANIDGFTPFMYAAWKGEVSVIEALVAAGGRVNAQNKYGSTALMWAVEGHQYDAARALILSGADLTIKNRHNKTAMDWAIHENDARMCRLLYMGRMRQLYLQIKYSSIAQVGRLIQLQKSEKISKSEIVDFMLMFEGKGEARLDFFRLAIATDKNGKPANGLSHFLHVSQGLGFKKFFCGEQSWAVARIKTEIHKILQEKAKSSVDMAPKFR